MGYIKCPPLTGMGYIQCPHFTGMGYIQCPHFIRMGHIQWPHITRMGHIHWRFVVVIFAIFLAVAHVQRKVNHVYSSKYHLPSQVRW